MRTSEAVSELLAALVEARKVFAPVRRESTGQVGRDREYQYADLTTLLGAVMPALLAHGLIVVQTIDAERSQLITRVLHASSGQWIESSYLLDLHQAPQAVGSQLTYSRRYSLQSLLCVSAEDDDGVIATAATKQKPRAKADRPPSAPSPSPPTNSARRPTSPLSDRQRRLVFATAREHGWSDDELRAELDRAFGYQSTGQLQREDLDQLLNILQRRPRVREATKKMAP